MTLEKDALLLELTQMLRKELGEDLKHLILFGSRARGDHAPDSDYDCLLVVSQVTPKIVTTIDQVAGELLFNYSVVFSIIPISETRYLSEPHHPLLKNIAREGVVL